MTRSTAFSDKHTNAIAQIIPIIANRVLVTLPAYPYMSHDDVLDMIGARGEQRQFLKDGRRIVEIADLVANSATMQLTSMVNVRVVVGGSGHPMMPKSPTVDHEWLKTDKGQKLLARAEALQNICDDWGCVDYVWTQLNQKMPTEAHVRYLWPSVLALMAACPDEQESLHQKRNKLLPVKVPQSIPAITSELRALIRRASTIVAMSTLLPPAAPLPSTDGRVTLSLHHQFVRTLDGYYTKNLDA